MTTKPSTKAPKPRPRKVKLTDDFADAIAKATKPAKASTSKAPATKRTNTPTAHAESEKIADAAMANAITPNLAVLDQVRAWPTDEDSAMEFARVAICEDQKRRKGKDFDQAVIDNFTAWAKAGRPHAKSKVTGAGGGGGRVSITDDELDKIVKGYVDRDAMCKPSDIFEGIRADGGKVGDKRTIASYLRVRRSLGLPDKPSRSTTTAKLARSQPAPSKAPAAEGSAGTVGKDDPNPTGRKARQAATKARREAQGQSPTLPVLDALMSPIVTKGAGKLTRAKVTPIPKTPRDTKGRIQARSRKSA